MYKSVFFVSTGAYLTFLGNRISEGHILITDITQHMEPITCWYSVTSSQFKRWYHRLSGDSSEKQIPNRPTHSHYFNYSGWYSTQNIYNGQMQLKLFPVSEYNAVEGIFTCKGNNEQVSVGVYYPSKFWGQMYHYSGYFSRSNIFVVFVVD